MLFREGAGVADARLRYRRDIDGLRGVAVLLVMADHLGVRGFAGGYIGVDVFFVISGYLISSIILPQIAAGTFSFRDFYMRRLRRIYPALLVMLAVTTPLAWHYLLPIDMRGYGKSLLASTFGVSNLFAIHSFGYFAPDVRFDPLLHTWSLGVEEQFYLLLPLILIACVWELGASRLRQWIGCLALLSFVAAFVCVQRDVKAAFYQPQFRAWELLTGVLLSLPGVPRLQSAWQRNAASLIGLAMIVLCVWQYRPQTLFPGMSALPVCLGAALILAAGETGSSVVGELLSLRPLVFVGLISYSLYLWHWPIQVFLNFHHVLDISEHVSRESKVFVLVASFAAATISWWAVELPFRRRGTIQARSVLGMAGVCMTVLAGCAIAITVHRGYPSRWPAEVVTASDDMDTDLNPDPGRWGICEFHGRVPSAFDWLSFPRVEPHIQTTDCLPFTPGRHHYLLVGDSHAAMLWSGLSHVFPELEIGQAGATMCGIYKAGSLYSNDPACAVIDHLIYDDLVRNHKVDTIILSIYWNQDRIRAATETIAYAHRYGVEVIVIGPTDAYNVFAPRLVAAAAKDPAKLARVKSLPWIRPLEPQMKTMARDVWNVKYISFYDDVCDGDKVCPIATGRGAPIMWDDNHLSREGSILFAQSIRDHHQLP